MCLDIKTLSNLLEKTSVSKILNENLEKASLSVLMVLSTYLQPFKLYRSKYDIFSITDWIYNDNEKNFLLICSRLDIKEDLNPLITAQIDIAINALRSFKMESSSSKIWFIIDELSYFN